MTQALAAPSSAAELCAAVRQTRPVTLSRLDRILQVDERAGRLEVQAGASWRSLAAELRPGDARAAAVRTSMPTVAESLAWNAAGPDGRPAVVHVEALALVTPDGQLCRVSRRERADLFALAVGGQNLFGVPYSATLRVPSLERAIREAAPAETVGRAEGDADAAPLEVLVPPDHLERFLARARGLCDDWRTLLHAIEARRVRQEEDTFLRWARQDYVQLRLHLAKPGTIAGAVRCIQLRQQLIDAAISTGGTFPISCTPEATREQTLVCYPELGRFIAEKRRLDRRERLVNPWYCRQRSLLERQACTVRWGR